MSVKSSKQAREEAAKNGTRNGDYFVPSHEYQEVPEWAQIPPGFEIIFPMGGEPQRVRWNDPVPGPEKVIDKRTGKPQEQSQDQESSNGPSPKAEEFTYTPKGNTPTSR
jgi:hypothetical protein